MATVVKVGGSILSGGARNKLMSSIASYRGDEMILVHGGGPAVTEVCNRLGIEPRFITSPGGIRSRFTDLQTMQAYLMAMKGKLNTELVASLQEKGRRAFGLSGIDGPTLIAERKKRLLTISGNGRKMFVDGGYTGRITHVDSSFVSRLLAMGVVPVLSPIAMSNEFEPLNVDGDRAASALSGSLSADRLVLLTNVNGVILEGETIPEIRIHEIGDYLSRVGNGMDRKLIAARESLEAGTGEVIIANGNTPDMIRKALNFVDTTVIRK